MRRAILRKSLEAGGFLPLALYGVTLLAWLIALSASGFFIGISYSDVQNSAFAIRLEGQPPLRAIKAAAEEVSPAFAREQRRSLARAANLAIQSADEIEFADSRPSEAAQAAWTDTYVCGLAGWGEHRGVVRKLVYLGYGECGRIARFAADSPIIYRNGAFGWVVVIFLWAAALALLAAAVLIQKIWRAHKWLYQSSLEKRS